MKIYFLLPVLAFLVLAGPAHSQGGVNGGGGIQIVTEDKDYDPYQVTVQSDSVHKGAQYDTIIFDTTWRAPFKLHEWRGEEMTHTWIHLGAPRAPHLYIGGGIYRFDKTGMTDIQIGWYPIVYPKAWETYFSFERMFFLKKKSKNVKLGVRVDRDYIFNPDYHYTVGTVNYVYKAPIRRDKFYGLIAGAGYNGWMNLRNNVYFIYHGEENVYAMRKFHEIHLKAGVGRMRCRNIEYEAPFVRKGLFRASSMSRLQLGVMYFPAVEYNVDVLAGTFDASVIPYNADKIAAYISWEGRTAIMHMKREWGLGMNFTLVTPSWNRVRDDLPIAITWTWGVYVSLDKRNPKWKTSNSQVHSS